MPTKTIILVLLGVAFIMLIVLVLIKNRKDKKELEDQLNRDIKKPLHHEDDMDTKI